MVLGAAFLGCEDLCNLLGFSIKAERSGCVVEALRAESFLVNQDGGIILLSQKTRKKGMEDSFAPSFNLHGMGHPSATITRFWTN